MVWASSIQSIWLCHSGHPDCLGVRGGILNKCKSSGRCKKIPRGAPLKKIVRTYTKNSLLKSYKPPRASKQGQIQPRLFTGGGGGGPNSKHGSTLIRVQGFGFEGEGRIDLGTGLGLELCVNQGRYGAKGCANVLLGLSNPGAQILTSSQACYTNRLFCWLFLLFPQWLASNSPYALTKPYDEAKTREPYKAESAPNTK